MMDTLGTIYYIEKTLVQGDADEINALQAIKGTKNVITFNTKKRGTNFMIDTHIMWDESAVILPKLGRHLIKLKYIARHPFRVPDRHVVIYTAPYQIRASDFSMPMMVKMLNEHGDFNNRSAPYVIEHK